MFVRVLALSFFLLALCSRTASAQSYSGALVQQLVASPHVQALGEATIGLRGYPGAAQLNPAGIGRRNVVQGSSSFHPGETVFLKTAWLPSTFDEDPRIWMIAPSVDVKLGAWAFGYMYREMSFGTFEERDAQNNRVGSVRVFDAVHKVTGAYDVTDDLAVGLSVNVVASRVAGASVGMRREREATAISIDLGLLYGHTLETSHVRIEPAVAWSLTDFGSKLDFGDSPTPLPMTMRGGVALRVASKHHVLSRPLVSVTLLGALSQEIEQVELEETPEGVQPDFVNPFVALFTGWKPVRVQSSWTEDGPQFERVGAWDQMRRHAGIDLALWDVLFLRWGSQYEHPRLGTRNFTSTGWGIDLYYVVFERATVKDDTGAFRGYTTSTLTVRVPLRHAPENFWIPLWRRIR